MYILMLVCKGLSKMPTDSRLLLLLLPPPHPLPIPQDSVRLLYDLLYIPEGGMGRVRVTCLTKNRTQLLGKR